MYSGGAEGSDRIWGEIAAEFGVNPNNIKHYYGEGHKTPYGNTPLTESQLAEANEALDRAADALGRDIENIKKNKPYEYSLLRRNYYQIKDATSVLAVGSFVKDKEGKITNKVSGGTAYAIEFAKEKGIPIYLYDQENKKWMSYEDGSWKQYNGIPTPTSNFAGIGTRKITEAGKQAIRDVFEKHIVQNTGEVAGIDLSGHTIYSVEHGFQLAKYKYALDKGAITKAEFDKAVKALDKAGKMKDSLASGAALKKVNTDVPINNWNEKMNDWDNASIGQKYSKSEQVMYQLIDKRVENDPAFREALKETKLAPLTHKEESSQWKTKFPEILDKIRRKHFYDNTKVGLKNGEKAGAENANKKSALESLEKKRSEQIGTPEITNANKASMLLARRFPKMRDRVAFINMVHNLFSNTVDMSVMFVKEQLKEKIDDGTATQEDIDNYDKLNISDTATARFEYLQMAAKGKYKLQSIFGDMQSSVENIMEFADNEGINELIGIIRNPENEDPSTLKLINTFFGDLLDYAQQKHPTSIAKQNSFMKTHIQSMIGNTELNINGHLKELLPGATPNNSLFNALLQAARFQIALTEGILFDAQTGDFFNTKSDEKLDDETEAMESQDKEHYMLKYQMLDPQSTLTKRMRYLLSNIPIMEYKNGRAQYVFDRFGMKMRMQPEIAFMNIIKEFSKLNDIREFDQKIKEFFVKHPWFKPIADKISQDKDFRNEFYRTFSSKGFSEFVIQDATGSVIIMNRGLENAEILQQMESNYLSGMTLTEDSIYDHEGRANQQKLDKWIKALTKVTDTVPGTLNTAGTFIKTFLDTKIAVSDDGKILTQETKKDPKVQLRNILNALEILNTGKNPFVENDDFDYSFKNLLNAMGIDTENVNLDALLPTMETINDVLNTAEMKLKEGKYEVRKDKRGNELSSEDQLALAQIYELQNTFIALNDIADVLDKSTEVLKKYKDNSSGNFFKDNQNYMLSIFNKLPIDHTKFESDKFYHGKTERHSYIAKSYMKLLESNLKNDNLEMFSEFVHNKYGQYDFMAADSQGKYSNSFLNEITRFTNPGELTPRAAEIALKLYNNFLWVVRINMMMYQKYQTKTLRDCVDILFLRFSILYLKQQVIKK
jgi:hypothetical protein